MALTITQLTNQIRNVLERNQAFQRIVVKGEVSNLTKHSSGHNYFTLKDETAQISAVMFRNSAQTLEKGVLEEGNEIIVEASLTVYPPRGSYQLTVTSAQKVGGGNLFKLFLERKEKLAAMGFFDPENKQALPAFPFHIAVITSPTGAVIRDIVRTLGRRWPIAKISLIPATVQGEAALPTLLQAFEVIERLNSKPDVVILARGGGSLEDLWCFNEEALAQAIFECPIPVVSAIGHETDFTIADFVADLRAPTPTAAAELVSPDRQQLIIQLHNLQKRLERAVSYRMQYNMQRLDDIELNLRRAIEAPIRIAKKDLQFYQQSLRRYGTQVKQNENNKLEVLESKLNSLIITNLQQESQKLSAYQKQLSTLDPLAILERGYSITYKNGKPIQNIQDVHVGDSVETRLANGSFTSKVIA